MPGANWPSGATTTTTSGHIPRWAIGVQQKRAGRLSNLRAPRPARVSNAKPTTIKPKDSRYDRGTTGGQVNSTRSKCINTATASYVRTVQHAARCKPKSGGENAEAPDNRRSVNQAQVAAAVCDYRIASDSGLTLTEKISEICTSESDRIIIDSIHDL